MGTVNLEEDEEPRVHVLPDGAGVVIEFGAGEQVRREVLSDRAAYELEINLHMTRPYRRGPGGRGWDA